MFEPETPGTTKAARRNVTSLAANVVALPISARRPHAGLAAALRATCAALAAALGDKNRLDVLADESRVAAETAALIVVVIREAVSNAIRHAHPTGVPGRITVVCQDDRKGSLVVGVTDDGVGLPENFDPLRDGGTGLRIMRALSERLNATLSFQSTPLGLNMRLRVPHVAAEVRDAIPFVQADGVNPQPDLYPLDVLEALPAAIYTTDADGRITFFNEAAATLWGCRPQLGKAEFCGSWRLYRPDGTALPHDQCPMAVALKTQRPVRGEEIIAERPDGSRAVLTPYPTPLFDGAGALTGAINMLVDISDHKHAERALARRRDEQAALYAFTDKLFRARTPRTINQAALDAIGRALGCSRASILLFDDCGVMRFVASRGLSESYRRAVEGHSPWARDVADPQPICIDDIETADIVEPLKATIRAEGIRSLAFFPLVVRGELIGKFMTYDEAPRAFGGAEVDLAVTIARQLGFSLERMRMEAARQDAEQASRLLAAVVATSQDAIVSKDLNGSITSWNSGAERVFGYTADEMIGQPITILIPPERHDEETQIIERVRRGERVEHYDTVRRRKDASLVDVSLAVSPVVDASGTVVGASKIARDITERRQAQARQELLNREISHRTKNLFAVVQALVSRSFEGKQSASEVKAALTGRLRSLAHTHTMLIDHEWQGADLADVVRTEMSPYLDRVALNGPSLKVSAQAAQNFALALHELATNAAKYGALSTPRGSVEVNWSLEGPESHRLLTFRWQERGGPPVSPPQQRGFGSAVLEQVMADYFEAPPRIDFAATGVRYELTSTLDAITPHA